MHRSINLLRKSNAQSLNNTRSHSVSNLWSLFILLIGWTQGSPNTRYFYFKNLAWIVWFVLITLLPRSTYSQGGFCASSEALEALMTENPDLIQTIEEQNNVLNIISQGKPSQGIVHTIPVVFHVIHMGEPLGQGTNISDALLQQGLDDLNTCFRNYTNTGTDTEIEFCFASRTPDDLPTNGINRVDGSSVSNYTTPNYGMRIGVNETALKGLSIWPNTKYLNIWIVNYISGAGGSGVTLGFAYPASAPPDVDGVVLRYDAIGVSNNKGIIVHETGHYFNLEHTFRLSTTSNCPPAGPCTVTGDYVCDTRPHKEPSGNPSCATNAATSNDCDSGNPIGALAYNHMNYTDNSCHDRFTPGQTSRMRNALEIYRQGLTYSIGCEEPCTDTEAGFTAPTSDIPVGTTVTFENTSTNASSFIWRIDGIEATDQTDLTYTFNFGGAYEICLDAEGQNCWERICKSVVVAPICIPAPDTCEILLNGNFEQIKSGQLSNTDFKPVCNWLSTFSSPFSCNTPTNKAIGLWLNTNMVNPPNAPANERVTTVESLPLQTNKPCVVSFDYLVANKTNPGHSVESIIVALTDGNASGPLPVNANIIAQIDTPAVDYVGQQNHDCYQNGHIWHHHAQTFTYTGDGKTYLNLSGEGLAPYSPDSFAIVFIDNVSIRCCGDTASCSPNPDFSFDGEGCQISFYGSNAGAPGLYHWDFGDGGTDSVQNVTHTFIFSDTFSVCLTVTCPDSMASATICKEIEVPEACNECGELDPVTAAICDTSSQGPNIFLANFSFEVPAGYKSCKPGNLFVTSPNATIEVSSYTIETNGANELITVALKVVPNSLTNFLNTGAIGYITLCSDTSDMICREFRILPQVCDNCMDEIHVEAYCADPDPHDDVYIYQGSVTVTVPSGSDSCAVFSPLSGFSSTFTQNSLTNWTVNFQITTHDKNLMYATALLCFVELTTGKTCIPLDITLLPCDVPDECVAEWSPKNMSCTGEEDGNYIFNISKSVYAGPYELCGGGLFGTIDGGGTVRINPIGNSVILNVFTFNIDILIPIDSFVDGHVYNLRLFLCDHLGNIVCYYFPLRLYCSGHRSGSGARNSDAARFNDDAESAYTIRPNPAKDKLMVVTKDFDREKQQEVRIMDQLGRTIIKRRLSTNVEEINVAAQLPGVYVVAILEAGIPVKIEKIVIIR